MRTVIQEERTGCGIAAAATIAEVSYARAKHVAESLGIPTTDSRLWSDTRFMRRLVPSFGVRVAVSIKPFHSWNSLPDAALLAIKWHRSNGKAFWHWTVFIRKNGQACVLDSKKSLKIHRRTDFGRMKPKWFMPLHGGKKARQLTD